MRPSPAPIDLAIDYFDAQLPNDGFEVLSIRQIAKLFHVDFSTLSRRLSCATQSYSIAYTHRQALTVEEEDALVHYIRRMTELGHPPSHHLVRETAEHLRHNRHLLEGIADTVNAPPLGKNWITKFQGRHPEVISTWTRAMDASRVKADSPEKLVPWFTELKGLLDRYQYQPNNIYNMDETGYGVGVIQSTRVLAVVDVRRGGDGGEQKGKERKKGKVVHVQPGRQEWVTVLECVSALGTALPPMVILKGKGEFNPAWRPATPDPSWMWKASKSGWTNNSLALEWLIDHFEPLTRPTNPNHRRLLIADGHGSHVQGGFIAFCLSNSIDLMILPSHSSHRTQPLDVGIFAPLKAALTSINNAASCYEPGRIQRPVWIARMAAARQKAMTESNIKVGWRETGIHPYSPHHVLRKLPDASTPPPSHCGSPYTPLPSLTTETRELLHCSFPSGSTPLKNRLSTVVHRLEASQARCILFEKEIKERKEAEARGKQPRKGVNVQNIGQHHFTGEGVLAKVQEMEAARQSKRRRRVDSEVPDDSHEPDEAFYTTAVALGEELREI